MAASADRPHLLLAGCGHAHLFVLEALARGRLATAHVTLVSPTEEYFYSGMIPGVVAGCYRPEAARFLPPQLARAAGAEWICDRVVRIDAARKRVHLGSGAELEYDLLSLDIGSRLAGDSIDGVARYAIPTKPLHRALSLVERAQAAVEGNDPRRAARIVVVGAGAAGIEMSLCLDARLTARYGRGRHRITVLEAGDRILDDYSAAFRDRATRLLGERGIRLRAGARADGVDAGELAVTGGSSLPFDVLLWATGPRAPGLPSTSGLPTDDSGYLLVRSTLQSIRHAEIFGSGDCVTLADHRWVSKAGVYAVRQGPILAGNIARYLDGRTMQQYHPQRNWLSLLNTGDGRALLHHREHVFHGRAAWWLKNRIDQRFVQRFHRLAA